MESMTDQFKILSDETRLRILHMLYHQDLCVCELVELLDESQPKISKHIAKIRANNYVVANQNQQYIYYSLNRKNEKFIVLLNTLFAFSNDKLREDYRRLMNKESFVCKGG